MGEINMPKVPSALAPDHAMDVSADGALLVASSIFSTILQYRLLISIITIIFLLFYRVVLANLLYVKRRDKVQWIIWGVLMAATLLDMLVRVDVIYVAVELGVIGFAIVYAYLSDKSRTVKSVIYSNSIVYEDNSDRYDSGDSERKNLRRMKDAKIKRGFKFSTYRMKMGVPVFSSKFTFMQSAMCTEEQLSKAVSYLNRYYDEYNWRKQKQKNGVKTEFSSDLKSNSLITIPFNKELSDQLDWCIVPVGAIDVSTKKAIEETPYVWKMQDPKTEGKVYDCLKHTKQFEPGPHAFVCGQTGGGKSVLVNTMIAHWINKAKTDRQVELYLADAKRVEFAPYESLKEVAGVAFTLEEAVELTDDFCKEMTRRTEIMEMEGIKDIPLNGKVTLRKSVNINNKIIKATEVLDFKTKDGKLHRARAADLVGRDDIAMVNLPDDKSDEEEEESGGRESMW